MEGGTLARRVASQTKILLVNVDLWLSETTNSWNVDEIVNTSVVFRVHALTQSFTSGEQL